MKLRNKKTGKIEEFVCVQMIEKRKGEYDVFNAYKSLNQLNAEWEDYKPVEPLIKDKKICKAVRAWAEANDLHSDYEVTYDSNIFSLKSYQASIEFNSPIKDLEHNKIYTIIELCGEEEE